MPGGIVVEGYWYHWYDIFKYKIYKIDHRCQRGPQKICPLNNDSLITVVKLNSLRKKRKQ